VSFIGSSRAQHNSTPLLERIQMEAILTIKKIIITVLISSITISKTSIRGICLTELEQKLKSELATLQDLALMHGECKIPNVCCFTLDNQYLLCCNLTIALCIRALKQPLSPEMFDRFKQQKKSASVLAHVVAGRIQENSLFLECTPPITGPPH
jgi:hypothetical protein